MADYDSSLPVRTEADGDVVAKISDATVTTQQLKVNADGSIDVNTSLPAGTKVELTDGTDDLEINADGSLNITDNGGSLTVDAADLDIRDLTHVSDSVKIGDGTEFAAVNASNELQVRDDDANTSLSTIAGDTTSIDAKLVDGNDIGDVTINNAAGAAAVNIQDGGNSITVDAADLDIRDLSASQDNVAISDGTDTLAVNTDGSINVNVLDQIPGTEVCEYNTSTSVAKNASVNHDYTVTAATTFFGSQAWVSGSGKLKAQLLVDSVVKFVGFNSTANPNIEIPLQKLVTAAAGEVVRITITNLDKQPQDLYSTLLGEESA